MIETHTRYIYACLLICKNYIYLYFKYSLYINIRLLSNVFSPIISKFRLEKDKSIFYQKSINFQIKFSKVPNYYYFAKLIVL